MASVQEQGRGRLRRAYVPRGPLPAGTLPELVAWARSTRLARLRVEPEAPPELGAALADLGFRRSTEIQPANTVIVELGPEDALLASFNAQTRRNIRLSERRGVVVEEGSDAEALAEQTAETAHRQRITLPSLDYYRLLLEVLPSCHTYVANHEGVRLAAILVAEFDGRAYYLYGGSTGRRSDLKASHAVQWAAMKAARARGCRDYDLWGVPPSADPSHPWFGLWQFKTGFSSEVVRYAGSWDLVIDAGAAALIDAQEALRSTVRRIRAAR